MQIKKQMFRIRQRNMIIHIRVKIKAAFTMKDLDQIEEIQKPSEKHKKIRLTVRTELYIIIQLLNPSARHKTHQGKVETFFQIDLQNK